MAPLSPFRAPIGSDLAAAHHKAAASVVRGSAAGAGGGGGLTGRHPTGSFVPAAAPMFRHSLGGLGESPSQHLHHAGLGGGGGGSSVRASIYNDGLSRQIQQRNNGGQFGEFSSLSGGSVSGQALGAAGYSGIGADVGECDAGANSNRRRGKTRKT